MRISRSADLKLELRTATLDDVGIVADLEATRDPEDPRDPQMLRHWWTSSAADEKHLRLVDERDGAALAFAEATHEGWTNTPARFGWIRAIVRQDVFTEANLLLLIRKAEDWLRSEGAATSVARVRGDFEHEVAALKHAGYREDRQQRISELDLVANRDGLLAGAEQSRRRMRDEGVTLMTLSQDTDLERMSKLYEITVEAEKDIPTTTPWHIPSFDEWKHFWLDNPGIRKDRFWIAREGDAIVGLSVLQFSPVRGLPWTGLTGTSRSVRGRGIARALKYESVAQAISLGYKRVRTNNDGANAPILHLNHEMGYQLVRPLIELHRQL